MRFAEFCVRRPAFTTVLIMSLVVTGLVIAMVIGFIGGLLPAIRAARMQVTTALRTQ